MFNTPAGVNGITLVGSSFVGSTTVPAFASILDSQSLRIIKPGDSGKLVSDHRQNPSSELWTSTGSSPATLSLLAVTVQGTVAGNAASAGITWDLFVFADVEFRTAL